MQARTNTPLELAAAVAGAAFLPAVLFVITPAPVIERNVAQLLYHASLDRFFVTAFLISWLALSIILLAIGRPRRLLVKAAIAVGVFILVEDLARPYVDAPGVSIAMAILVDLIIAGGVVFLVFWPRYGNTIFVATTYAAIATTYAAYAHVTWVKELPARLQVEAKPGTDRAYGQLPSKPHPNVYHIVLDTFPAGLFLDSARAGGLKFPGFRFYRNFNTAFPRTEVALPGLFRGRFPQRSEALINFMKNAAQEGFWKNLADDGVPLWLYAFFSDHCAITASHCKSLARLLLRFNQGLLRYTIVDLWALKILPHSLRQFLNPKDVHTGTAFAGTEKEPGFSTTRHLLRALGREAKRGTGKIHIDYLLFGLEQFDLLLQEEAQRPRTGQYVFWHGMFPHGPQVLDRFCRYPIQVPKADRHATIRESVECATRLARRLVDRLQELGRFDDALIIIQADHGMSDLVQYGPAFEGRMHNQDPSIWPSEFVQTLSAGLLLVKTPKAKGALMVDDSPAQMIDIAPTILTHFGLPPNGFPGVPIDRLADAADRPILFFATTRSEAGTPRFSKYRKTGSRWELVRDP